MAGRKGAPPAAAVDPADRALRAAQECRAATREAHEALQGIRGAIAEVRDLIKEAQQFTLDHVKEAVPTEVKRQLDALEPVIQKAMRASVEKVEAEFERIEKIFLGTEDDSKPSIEELGVAFLKRTEGKEPACPHCGYSGTQEAIGGDKDLRPQTSGRSVSLCSNCLKPSIFVTGPLPGDLALRKPTPVETAQLAKQAESKRAARIVRQRAGDE